MQSFTCASYTEEGGAPSVVSERPGFCWHVPRVVDTWQVWRGFYFFFPFLFFPQYGCSVKTRCHWSVSRLPAHNIALGVCVCVCVCTLALEHLCLWTNGNQYAITRWVARGAHVRVRLCAYVGVFPTSLAVKTPHPINTSLPFPVDHQLENLENLMEDGREDG